MGKQKKLKCAGDRPQIEVSKLVLNSVPVTEWPANLELCKRCAAGDHLVCEDNQGYAPGGPLVCGCPQKIHVDHWDETGFRAFAGQVRL